MRVVFVTHNYPRHAGDLAGGFLHPLAVALRHGGVEVEVVAPSDQGRGGEDVLDGVPVSRVRYASPGRERYAYTGAMRSALRSPAGLAALLRMGAALRRETRRRAGGAATVVHAHWWVPAGLAAPPELPLVVTLHGTDAMLLGRSAAARALARPVLRRARVVTTVSRALAGVVAGAARLPLEAIRVQPMPVDTGGWDWSAGGAGLLVVSRLVAQKRVDLALEALAVLHDVGRHFPLTIVGDGPERPALEALAKRLGVAGQVRFTGALPAEGVLAALMGADVALVPAVGEGFGLVAAEALMAGVPVVACRDGGGLLDVVPVAGAGRLAEPDPAALAQATGALLDDPGARAAARASGEEWRARLAPAAVAARFREWYAEALGA